MDVLVIAILVLLFLISACYAYWKLYFLRDPVREIPKDDTAILSPADGRIARIVPFSFKEIKKKGKNAAEPLIIDKGLLGKIKTYASDIADEGYLISIVMTPLDVHFQRAPIEGKITNIVYKTGAFRNAVHDAKSLVALENEKNEITIENKNMRIKVIQIAGFLARRIECYVVRDEKIFAGQKIGLINLGSQVTLIIPKIPELLVTEGEYVYGGTTLIGRIR